MREMDMNRSPLRALGTLGLATTLALIPASIALALDTPPEPVGDTHTTPNAEPDTANRGNSGPSDLKAQLRQVRSATLRYQNVRLAEADGFTLGESCIPGLGYHFVREVAEGQGQLDITEPNSLMYAPQPDGSLKLVGVGYVSKRSASLFGQEFSQPATLPYYTLHAWVWEENPDGVFEHVNPNITCPDRGER
jgi:hypothetical protein